MSKELPVGAPEVLNNIGGVVMVKVYAHRVGLIMADLIVRQELDAARGMRRAFEEWLATSEYELSRSMLSDSSIEKISIMGTDRSGSVLVGIRVMRPQSVQLMLNI